MSEFFTQNIPTFFTYFFTEWVPNFFTNLVPNFFQSLRIQDFFDIALVAFLIYSIIQLVRDSRAEQLLKGILLFALVFFLASVFKLRALKYILDQLFGNIFVLLIIVFQPEIRRALEQVAQSRLSPLSFFGLSDEESRHEIKHWQTAITAVCESVDILKKQRMGALIVFERATKLGEIIATGTILDSVPTAELIANIFYSKAPLHDGAMIMRNGKVYAAGCILPLSENFQIGRELGTRHRAGVGMSENSDAVVVIVSEETATVSLAISGELKRNFTTEALQVALENAIIWERARDIPKEGSSKKNKFFSKFRKKHKDNQLISDESNNVENEQNNQYDDNLNKFSTSDENTKPSDKQDKSDDLDRGKNHE